MFLKNDSNRKIFWRVFVDTDTIFAIGYRDGFIDAGSENTNDIYAIGEQLKLEIREPHVGGRSLVHPGRKWWASDRVVFLEDGRLLTEAEATDVTLEGGVFSEIVSGLTTYQMFDSINYPHDAKIALSFKSQTATTQSGETVANASVSHSDTQGSKAGLSGDASAGAGELKAGVKADVSFSSEVKNETSSQITSKSGYEIKTTFEWSEDHSVDVPKNTLVCIKWVCTRTYLKGKVRVGNSRVANLEATLKYSYSHSKVQVSKHEDLSQELRDVYEMQFGDPVPVAPRGPTAAAGPGRGGRWARTLPTALPVFEFPTDVNTPTVFDASFYVKTYDDLRLSFGGDYDKAMRHWYSYGVFEGRRGNTVLDSPFYLSHHEDLAKAFGRDTSLAVKHWFSHGLHEGRRSSFEFDVSYYLSIHSDLVTEFGADNFPAAVSHWQTRGLAEGRRSSEDFDVSHYLSSHSDLVNALGAGNYAAAFAHWLRHGKAEGRRATP